MTLEQRIVKKLKPFCTKERAMHDKSYMSTSLILLGSTMPEVRKVANDIFTELQLPHKKMREEMNKLWKTSNIFSVLTVPLVYYLSQVKTIDLSDWKILKSWTEKIENWAHSDYLSAIISVLLDKYPEEIYPTIKKWNVSNNSWQRRLSLTSLLFYSRTKTKPLHFSKIFPLIEARLADKDPFVQKAVGWQLRECHNLWPQKTKLFITKNAKNLSAIAFSYSTEKWNFKNKNVIKLIRKNSRKDFSLRSKW